MLINTSRDKTFVLVKNIHGGWLQGGWLQGGWLQGGWLQGGWLKNYISTPIFLAFYKNNYNLKTEQNLGV